MKEEGVVWRMTIAAKFGTDERLWFTKVGTRSHGKSMWKKIGVGGDKFQECIG